MAYSGGEDTHIPFADEVTEDTNFYPVETQQTLRSRTAIDQPATSVIINGFKQNDKTKGTAMLRRIQTEFEKPAENRTRAESEIIHTKEMDDTEPGKNNSPRNNSRRKSIFSGFKKIFSRKHEKEDALEAQSSMTQNNEPLEIKDKLDTFIVHNYNLRENGRPHGRGICVMFTLFTGDMPGYLVDRTRAFNFFRNKLGYDVFSQESCYSNCSKEQLESTIRRMQKEIQEKTPSYDRFVFIILTHGVKEGLLTCNPDDKTHILPEQWENGRSWKYVITKVEDIVACFKHDQVPKLKDKPKLFLVQACRGGDIVRAAGENVQQPQYDPSNFRPELKVPIDADILVFYAATPDNKCWVHKLNGSWFMQRTLDVFERHYKTSHVEEMLTLVNFLIAEERDKKTETAVQMSCKFSTFRKNFFL